MYNKPFHTADLSKFSFLVTGGAGFIGSNIVEYLMKYGAGKVKVVDNLSSGFKQNIEAYLSSQKFEFIEGDICESDFCRKACKDIDYVIHQAALCSVPRSIEDPVTTNKSNVCAFVNLMVAAKEAKVKRIVYASSSSVYGDDCKLPKKENCIGRPLSPYAVSKLADELYADVFAKTYNLEIIGLRYFNIFGPHQNPSGPYAAAIPLFMEAMLYSKPVCIYDDGKQTRDFTFVENAVQGNIKALFTENPKALNQVFNIAVGSKISINKLFNTLKNLTGAAMNPVYKPKRTGDIKDSFADITKAKQLLDYNPEVKIEEGLKITLDWFKKHPEGI